MKPLHLALWVFAGGLCGAGIMKWQSAHRQVPDDAPAITRPALMVTTLVRPRVEAPLPDELPEPLPSVQEQASARGPNLTPPHGAIRAHQGIGQPPPAAWRKIERSSISYPPYRGGHHAERSAAIGSYPAGRHASNPVVHARVLSVLGFPVTWICNAYRSMSSNPRNIYPSIGAFQPRVWIWGTRSGPPRTHTISP